MQEIISIQFMIRGQKYFQEQVKLVCLQQQTTKNPYNSCLASPKRYTILHVWGQLFPITLFLGYMSKAEILNFKWTELSLCFHYALAKCRKIIHQIIMCNQTMWVFPLLLCPILHHDFTSLLIAESQKCARPRLICQILPDINTTSVWVPNFLKGI